MDNSKKNGKISLIEISPSGEKRVVDFCNNDWDAASWVTNMAQCNPENQYTYKKQTEVKPCS